MDARSIAATAINNNVLTPADSIDFVDEVSIPDFDEKIYEKRVYNGYKHPEPDYPLVFGPNIKDWPTLPGLSKNLLIKIVSHIEDDVTTTDKLIPSGETSSYRSNPYRLSEFTLSRRDPDYVRRARETHQISTKDKLNKYGFDYKDTNIGSAIYAHKPGDGSAREQAASCQRVLGGVANFAREYATKRYRSNCINWGILPFTTQDYNLLQVGSYVYIEDILGSIINDAPIKAYSFNNNAVTPIHLELNNLTNQEKQILIDGCLINYYKLS